MNDWLQVAAHSGDPPSRRVQAEVEGKQGGKARTGCGWNGVEQSGWNGVLMKPGPEREQFQQQSTLKSNPFTGLPGSMWMFASNIASSDLHWAAGLT